MGTTFDQILWCASVQTRLRDRAEQHNRGSQNSHCAVHGAVHLIRTLCDSGVLQMPAVAHATLLQPPPVPVQLQ